MSNGETRSFVDSNLTTVGRSAARPRRTPLRRLALLGASVASLGWLMTGSPQPTAVAGPEGANVLQGIAGISQIGNSWFITASNGAVIEYSSFNISPLELVQFLQPGSNAAVLNLIPSGGPTTIDGSLLSNGIVYFANPDGIVFGNNAYVNVGGIYAAAGSININDVDGLGTSFEQAIQGGTPIGFNLTGDINVLAGADILAGQPGAHLLGQRIVNAGTISADAGGMISLIAHNGQVTLSTAGSPNGHYYVNVDTGFGADNGNIGGTGIVNQGTLSSNGGQVVLGASDVYSLAIRLEGSGIAANPDIEGDTVVFHGDVELGTDIAIQADDTISFSNDVFGDNGNENLTLTSGTNSTVDGAIHTLQDLTVHDGTLSAGSIAIGGELASTNAASVQSANGISAASTDIVGNLFANSGQIAISGLMSVDGSVTAGSGSVNAGSAVVGGTTFAFNNVQIGGTASFGDDVIAVTGDINIDDNVTLTGDVHLSAAIGTIDIDGDVSGAHNLQFTSNANESGVTVNGAIAGGVVDLSVNGGDLAADSIDIAGNLLSANGVDITTSGAAGTDVDGTASLGGNLTAQQGNIDIAGQVTITGANVEMNANDQIILGAGVGGNAGTENLTLTSGTNSTVAGAIDNLNDLTVNGGDLAADSIDITGNLLSSNGVDITTSGAAGIDVDGAASLGGNLTAQQGNIDVAGQVTITGANVVIDADDQIILGADVAGDLGTENLTLSSGTGSEVVGAVSSLDNLIIQGGGFTGSDVTLTSALDLTGVNGGEQVSVTGNLQANELLTAAEAYEVLLTGGATIEQAVEFLNTNGVTLGGGATYDFNGGLTSTASTTTLDGTINAIDNEIVFGEVLLSGDSEVNTTTPLAGGGGGGDITYGVINSTPGNYKVLESNAGAGSVTFDGAVGTAADGQLGGLGVTAATIHINGGSINTMSNAAANATGYQEYNGQVLLGANTTLMSAGGDNGDGQVSFLTTVDSTGDGNVTSDFHTLAIDAGTGDVAFGGAVGSAADGVLGELHVTGGTISLAGGSVTTMSNGVAGASGDQTFVGNVVLQENTVVTTIGGDNGDGSIEFAGAIDSSAGDNRTLDLDAGAGQVTFGGQVGGSNANADGELGSLHVTASQINVDGGLVRTEAGNGATGKQLYDGPVVLGADAEFEAIGFMVDPNTNELFAIEFLNTIDSDGTPHNLTVKTTSIDDGDHTTANGGGIWFHDSVGSNDAIGSFAVMVGESPQTNWENVEQGAIILFGEDGGGAILVVASDVVLNNFLDGLDQDYNGPGDNGVDGFLHTNFAQIGSFNDLTFLLNGPAGSDLFTMGIGQRLTVLGDLTINGAGGKVYIGDINTLGDMNITADEIHIILRPWLESDPLTEIGVDYTAGGNFNFNGNIVYSINPFAPPLFINPTGGAPAGEIGFIFNPPLELFFDGGRFLDIKPQGVSTEDLSDAIAAAIPAAAQAAEAASVPVLAADQRQRLLGLGIEIRNLDDLELIDRVEGRGFFVDYEYDGSFEIPVKGAVAIPRLSAAEAQRVLDIWSQLNEQKDSFVSSIRSAWDAYVAEAGMDASLEQHLGWIAGVRDGANATDGLTPDQARNVLATYDLIAEFLEWLEPMGLVTKEVDVTGVAYEFLRTYAPGISPQEFRTIILGSLVP